MAHDIAGLVERIILRRLHEGRIDGYTIEMAKEIADALSTLTGTGGDVEEMAKKLEAAKAKIDEAVKQDSDRSGQALIAMANYGDFIALLVPVTVELLRAKDRQLTAMTEGVATVREEVERFPITWTFQDLYRRGQVDRRREVLAILDQHLPQTAGEKHAHPAGQEVGDA